MFSAAKATAMPATASREGEAGGDRGAECDDEQDDARDPGEQLGAVQGLLVGFVEVMPDRPLAGHLGAGPGREVELLDVACELACGFRQLGVLPGVERDRDEGGAAVGGE